jgi:hypothetical protein
MTIDLVGPVSEAMQMIGRIHESSDGIYVTTHCMYPTNAFVSVVIRGGQDTFMVSDEGRAFHEIHSSGTSSHTSDAQVRQLVKAQGLIVERGSIRSPFVKREELPVAIALVANVSKEVADWFYTHHKIKRLRDFKKIVKDFLQETFPKKVKHGEIIIGNSNKAHRFDNVVVLPNGGRLIVDPALHEHASWSSRIVANLDVRQAQHPGLDQRIVFDDDEDWTPEELNLLTVGAPAVAFGRSRQAIAQYAQ